MHNLCSTELDFSGPEKIMRCPSALGIREDGAKKSEKWICW